MLFSSSAVAQGQGELISMACTQCDPEDFSGYFFESYWTNDQSQSTGECEWRCENESITFDKSNFCSPNKPISGVAVLMKLNNDQGNYTVIGDPQFFNFSGSSSTGPHVFQLDQSDPTGIYRISISVSYGDKYCDEGFIDPSYCVSGIAESGPLVTVNGVQLSTNPDDPTFFCGAHDDPQYLNPDVLLSGMFGSGDFRLQGFASGGGRPVCATYLGYFLPFDGSDQSEFLNLETYPCEPFYPPGPNNTPNQLFEYVLTVDWDDNPCNEPTTLRWYLEFEPIDGIIEYDYVMPENLNQTCNGGVYEDGIADADVSVPGPSLGETSMGITTGSVTLQNATMTGYSVFITTGTGDQVYSSLNNAATALPYTFSPISHVANPGFVDGNANFFQLHSSLSPADCANDPYCTDGVQYFITVEINTSECGSLTRTTPFTICQSCAFCFQTPTNTGQESLQASEESVGSSVSPTRYTFNRYDNTLTFQSSTDLEPSSRSFFTITNVLGQEIVLKDEIGSRFQSWDLSSIRTGIYVVTVYGEGEPFSEILVK